MRSTTNILIINLAIADLIYIVFCAPFTATEYALPYWPFGDVWCRMFLYQVFVSACVSIYTLVLMSLDRFLAVAYPVASMSIRTKRNAYLAISCTWAVILISFIPALVVHGESTRNNYTVCTFLVEKGYSPSAFQVSLFVLSYAIPLSLIFVLYLLMLKGLWLGVARVGKCSAVSVRSKKRATRMVFVVVVIFAVCWCPLQIVALLSSLNAYELNDFKLFFRIGAHILAYFNSCINPILYAFLSENFRKAFLKVLSRSSLRACRLPDEDRGAVA